MGAGTSSSQSAWDSGKSNFVIASTVDIVRRHESAGLLPGFNEDDYSAAGKQGVDPVLEKLRSLNVVTPIFKPQSTDASITEILLQRSQSQSSGSGEQGGLDPTTTAKLFTLYQEWQRMTAAKVGKLQEDLGFKIIGVEELSMKLFHRLNYASNIMESSATHLREVCMLPQRKLCELLQRGGTLIITVHLLHHEVAEMKRALSKSLDDYEALRQNVNALGLQKHNIKPMAIDNQLNSE